MSDAALNPPVGAPADTVRVYVWEVPVRITHWLIAGSIVVLSATGSDSPWPLTASCVTLTPRDDR